MRALSIRQPFAELILRGIKTAEFRSRPTRIIGERFYIYASRGATKRRSDGATQGIWSRDLAIDGELPAWMIEIAEQVKLIPPGAELPTGVIVGSAVISRCERIEDRGSRIETASSSPSSILHPPSSLYRWHLSDIERATRLRRPTGHPQPVWFNPFD